MGAKSRTQMGRAAKIFWAGLTPEQRSAEMKRRIQVGKRRRRAEAKANLAAKPERTQFDGQASETQVAYLCGRVEETLGAFARSKGLSYPELAKRVGSILAGQTRG